MRWREILITIFLLLPCVTEAETKKDSLFDWSASATLTSNYIWRGLYVGGPS